MVNKAVRSQDVHDAISNTFDPLKGTRMPAGEVGLMLYQRLASVPEFALPEWQPIETAPKEIQWKNGFHNFGPLILAYPVNGKVDTVAWWQSERRADACNFLDGGGNAAHPTHWMPLPDPPDRKTPVCDFCHERPGTIPRYRSIACEPCYLEWAQKEGALA